MDTAEIRRRFVAHFERDGHTPVPSASLLLDDPNLLFVNAGMVPFKPYFLGQETPPYNRATSVQKCVRTPDIEDVGKTTRHGTFFEMCGNFSFGDYFKEHAIELAWDLVTKSQADGGWGFEESKLYPSILDGDDRGARSCGARSPACPTSGSSASGKKENYWSMGVPGPGGPCSEILIDRGPAYGADGDFSRRGPLPGVLEPGLHAGRAQRGAVQGGLRHRRLAAEEEHRHRHGSRAGRVHDPGRREHVRDRRDVPGHPDGRAALRPPVRRRPRGRRPVPGRRRPRPQLDDADRRRRHPRQRGAAATCCAGCCAARSARCGCSATRTRRCPSCCRSAATRWGRPTPALPPGLGADLDGRVRRGARLPADPARRHLDLRPGDHRA